MLPTLPSPILVGRERELVALRECLDAALAGHGSLVLIGGEAGIGKTALAEAVCHEAEAQGALVLVGRCFDLTETPPYGPWTEALARAPVGDGLPTLPTAVLPPEHGGESLLGQDAILRRVRDYLTALAATQSVVLLLDDLHWADPVSLDLLRVVGRSLADMPLLLLTTYRVEEVGRDHPLATLLPLLVREARAARLDLRPLDTAAIDALVAARYIPGEADHDRLVRYLAGRSEGNPLFLGELLRTLEGEGVLHAADDRWAVGDLEGVPVPTLLRQVIEGRLHRLGPETERLLAVAAVIGQEVPLALWAAVGDVGVVDLHEHIDRVSAARLLAETLDGARVRFAHALIREALYEGLPLARRRGWHRRAAEMLLAMPQPDPDAVAHHFRQARDPRALEWLMRAGERARQSYAWTSAAGRYEAALGLADPGTPAADRRGWLLLRLAALLRYADARRSLAYMDEAVRWAAEVHDAPLAAFAAFYRGQMRVYVEEFRRGVRELVEGTDALDALPPEERGRLVELAAAVGFLPGGERGYLAHWLAHLGRYVEARAMGERVAAETPTVAVSGGGTSPYGDAHYAVMQACAMLGEPGVARQAYERARDLYAAAAHLFNLGGMTADALTYLALPYYTDDLVWRRELARLAEETWAQTSGAMATEDPARALNLPLLLLEGRWDEAEGLCQAIDHRMGARVWESNHALHSLIGLARMRGRTEEAQHRIDRYLPDGSATEPGEFHCKTTLVLQRYAAALATDAGDLTAARAWLGAHDRWLAWSGAVLGRAEGRLCWAAFHRAAGDSATAMHDARAALAYASNPRQPLQLIAAHRLLGELATDAARFDDAARHLTESLVIADICAAPYERALTMLALAGRDAAMGNAAEARCHIDDVRSICTPLGATPILERTDALAARIAAQGTSAPLYPAGLTAREVEVLRLAATGKTNREIAGVLFLSPGTINIHLTHIFTKTGTANRVEAAAFALRHGLA